MLETAQPMLMLVEDQIKNGTGTGNASCRVCGNVITKEQTNIKLCNARVNGQVHSNPFDCSEVRIDMLGLDDEKEGEVNEQRKRI